MTSTFAAARRFFPAALGAALAIVDLAQPANAEAFERQQHFGIGGGVSMLKVDDKPTLSIGAGGGLHYTYGLSDQFNLVAESTTSIVALNQQQDSPESPRTRPSGVDTLGVGVAYVFDVLRYVPYIGVLPTGYLLTGGTLPDAKLAFGAAIALGMDYQLERNWAIGVAFRQHMVLSEQSTYPTYSQLFLRAEYVWGW